MCGYASGSRCVILGTRGASAAFVGTRAAQQRRTPAGQTGRVVDREPASARAVGGLEPASRTAPRLMSTRRNRAARPVWPPARAPHRGGAATHGDTRPSANRLWLARVQHDGLSPHYGRITVTSGQARLLLWEGGGSVCDETLAATSADQVIFAARARAQQLIEAYPTRPEVEPELLGGSRPSDRRDTRHRARRRSP